MKTPKKPLKQSPALKDIQGKDLPEKENVKLGTSYAEDTQKNKEIAKKLVKPKKAKT